MPAPRCPPAHPTGLWEMWSPLPALPDTSLPLAGATPTVSGSVSRSCRPWSRWAGNPAILCSFQKHHIRFHPKGIDHLWCFSEENIAGGFFATEPLAILKGVFHLPKAVSSEPQRIFPLSLRAAPGKTARLRVSCWPWRYQAPGPPGGTFLALPSTLPLIPPASCWACTLAAMDFFLRFHDSCSHH